MRIGFERPFLTIQPAPEECQNLLALSWVFPFGSAYGAYWTYLEALQCRFPGITWDESAAGLAKMLPIRSDLQHLPAWDRSKIGRYFHDEYKPRDYQADGIFYLLNVERAIVADIGP